MTPEQYHLLSLGRDPYESSRTDDGKSRYIGGDVKVLGPKPTSDVDTWSLDPIKEMGQGVGYDMYRVAEAMNPAPSTGFAEGKPSAIGDLYNFGKFMLTNPPAETLPVILESMNPSSHGGMTNLAMMPFGIKGAPKASGIGKTEAMSSPSKEANIGFSNDIEDIRASQVDNEFINSRRQEGVKMLEEGMPLPLYNVHGTVDSAKAKQRDMHLANRDLSTDDPNYPSVLPSIKNKGGSEERLGRIEESSLTPSLSEVVEEPLLGLFGELSRQGHLPISSNYSGPQRKGIYYIDSKYVKDAEKAFREVDEGGFEIRGDQEATYEQASKLSDAKMQRLQAIDERVKEKTGEPAVKFARHKDDPLYHPWHPIEDSRIDVGFEEKGLLDKWIESEGDIDNISFVNQHFGYPYSEAFTTKGLSPEGFPLFSQNVALTPSNNARQSHKIYDPSGQHLELTPYDREAPAFATGIPETQFIEEMLSAYNPEIHDVYTNIYSANTKLGDMSDLSATSGLRGRSKPLQGLMNWFESGVKKGNPPVMAATLDNTTLAHHLGDRFRSLLNNTDVSPEKAALAGKGVGIRRVPVTSLPNKATYNLFGGQRAHDTDSMSIASSDRADEIIKEMMHITETGSTNYKSGVRLDKPVPVSPQQVKRTQQSLDAMEATARPNVFSKAYKRARNEAGRD